MLFGKDLDLDENGKKHIYELAKEIKGGQIKHFVITGLDEDGHLLNFSHGNGQIIVGCLESVLMDCKISIKNQLESENERNGRKVAERIQKMLEGLGDQDEEK